jgi:hypothetical protein
MSEEKMVEKLHLNRNNLSRGWIGGISSQDEQELLRFLHGKKVTISKMERKYLLKYVIKGLPEGVRGRVSKPLDYVNFIVLAGLLRGPRLQEELSGRLL